MAHIDGCSLNRRLDQLWDVRVAVRLVHKLARALDAVHQAGIIHRDIKPGNILIDTAGEPFLTDFGLARTVADDEQLTSPGAVLGTPAYMAPEQAGWNGHAIGPAADIYSLGLILYQMVAGKLPFDGSKSPFLDRLKKAPPSPCEFRPELDSALADIVLRAIALSPEQRIADADAFASVLKHWLDGQAMVGVATTTASISESVTPCLAPKGKYLVLSGLPGNQPITVELPEGAREVKLSMSGEDGPRKNRRGRWRLAMSFSLAVLLITALVLTWMFVLREQGPGDPPPIVQKNGEEETSPKRILKHPDFAGLHASDLLDALKNPDVEVCLDAIAVLEEKWTRDGRTLDAFFTIISNQSASSPEVIKAATAAIDRFPLTPKNLSTLIEACQGSDARQRLVAARTLRRVDDWVQPITGAGSVQLKNRKDEAMVALESRLSDSDKETVWEAAYSLAVLGSRQPGVRRVFESLSQQNDAKRQEQGRKGLALLAKNGKKEDQVIVGGINESIDRGVAYLKAQLNKDEKLYHRSDMFPGNAHLGAAALAGLTLVECGVAADDSAVQSALRLVRNGQGQIYSTYTLSVSIMFLDRLHQAKALPPEDRKLIGEFAERLLTSQHENGFWGYGKLPQNALPQSKGGEREAAGKIIQHRDYVNLSNSQFAALALWIAKHHDAKVVSSLKLVAQKARERQKQDGTWWYDHGYTMAQTSTCAGLIFLAIEMGLNDAEDNGWSPKPLRAGEKPPKSNFKVGKPLVKDPAVEKGLAALGKWVNGARPISEEKRLFRQKASQNIREYHRLSEAGEENLPVVLWTMDYAFSGTIFGADSWGDLYLLWSIERVAVIYDLRKIGNRDWYAWGSEIIVSKQQGDGSWQDRFPGVPDTCFALLFLKRANTARYLTDKLRELMTRAEISNNLPAPTPTKKE